jgi:hypothetical protein
MNPRLTDPDYAAIAEIIQAARNRSQLEYRQLRAEYGDGVWEYDMEGEA